MGTQAKTKALYQVHVETDEGVIPVLPRVSEKETAQRFLAAVDMAIIARKLTGWRHPHLVTYLAN